MILVNGLLSHALKKQALHGNVGNCEHWTKALH